MPHPESKQQQSQIMSGGHIFFLLIGLTLSAIVSVTLLFNIGTRTSNNIENEQILLNWIFDPQHDRHDVFRTIERDFESTNLTNDAIEMDPQLKSEIRLREYMRYFTNRTETKKLLVQNFENVEDNKYRRGLMVLGTHQSGTSMLAGMLVKGLGYHVGPNHALLKANFDNETGFFERSDAAVQNDAFMRAQSIDYNGDVIMYNVFDAFKMLHEKKINFDSGTHALKFMNDESNVPWVQKDPRMCITIRTWLPLLEGPSPAVVFSFRHPLEVAMSLMKGDAKIFPLAKGLRLWIVYNMRAIQNSHDLCRVFTSNEALMLNPKNELESIAAGLVKCGLVSPNPVIDQAVVNDFIDPNLRLDPTKHVNVDKVLTKHDDGRCIVYDYKSYLREDHPERGIEMDLYKIAMKTFCDMKSGAAYEAHYPWPSIP